MIDLFNAPNEEETNKYLSLRVTPCTKGVKLSIITYSLFSFDSLYILSTLFS